MAVFKKVMAKIMKFLTMVISIFIGVSNSSEGSILYFLPQNVVLPKKQVFTLGVVHK